MWKHLFFFSLLYKINLRKKKPKIPTKDTIKVLSYKVGLNNNLDRFSHLLSTQFTLVKKTLETFIKTPLFILKIRFNDNFQKKPKKTKMLKKI